MGSLPDSVTDDTLRNEFSKYGEVLHAIVLKDMATQMVRGATLAPLALTSALALSLAISWIQLHVTVYMATVLL